MVDARGEIVDMTRHQRCPFCGSEPVLRVDDPQEPEEFRRYEIGCSNILCPAYIRSTLAHETKDDAWEAWDTRYVEECEYEFLSNMMMGPVSLNCCGLRCSRCGREQMDLRPPNFCPDCGFRVRKPEREMSEEEGYVEWRT